jgi:site-specific DNA-methyltransferase (adenine-specific)
MSFERVEIGPCTLYRGDCLEVLPTLTGIDAVITDPPYGVGLDYGAQTDDTTEKSYQLTKAMVEHALPVADVILTTVGCFAIETRLYAEMPPKWRICWRKGITSRPSAVGFTDWEPVFVYGRGSVHRHSHDLFTAQPEQMGRWGHPCPKSVDWAVWLVERFVSDGNVGCDPFMGSGTTGVACIQTGRRFIGIEKEPAYFEIAKRRIEQAWRDERSKLPMELASVQPPLFE